MTTAAVSELYQPRGLPGVDDKVTIGRPADGETCFSARCRRERRQATVTVTFGWFSNYMFWRDSRGKRYPMCDADADQTVGYLREHP